jgi:hypothetical protein
LACDICNSDEKGTLVTATNIRNAVSKGFNPFQLGLVRDIYVKKDGFEKWETFISMDHSDWDVCPNCLRHLLSYISVIPSKNGAQSISVADRLILDRVKGIVILTVIAIGIINNPFEGELAIFRVFIGGIILVVVAEMIYRMWKDWRSL